MVTAFSLAAAGYSKVYFQIFMCAAFSINIYYAWKVKIVYDNTKICLLSKELVFVDFFRAAVIILINIGGFFIFSYFLLSYLMF